MNIIDMLIYLKDGSSKAANLVLPHRILGDLYLKELDYLNAIKSSEIGLSQLKRRETENGRSLPQCVKHGLSLSQ